MAAVGCPDGSAARVNRDTHRCLTGHTLPLGHTRAFDATPGLAAIMRIDPGGSVSPQSNRTPILFGDSNASFDAHRVFMVLKAGSNGCGDGAGAPGGASHIRQRADEIASASEIIDPVGGMGAQA